MNYQQAIADATKQIRCRSVAADAAATTDAATGSGFLSCCPAVADGATVPDSSTTTAVGADADARATTADAAAGSGFSSFCAAAATATTAVDAANGLTPGGPRMRALTRCNNGYPFFIYMIMVGNMEVYYGG